MQTTAGIWIDHREAVIVLISEKGEEIKRITSSVEKQLRRSGRSRPRSTYNSRGTAGGNSREQEYRGSPADYHDEIIAFIGDAHMIFVFGPGEAKDELKKRIERNPDDKRIVRVEESGETTEDQIVAKVRKHFRTRRKSGIPTWDTTPPEDVDCEG